MQDVYTTLAKRLHQMPNGFPPTESGVELRILKKIFSPDEAEMHLKLMPFPETVEAISNRLDMPVEELQPILDNMVNKGQIGSAKMYGNQVYLVMPFIVGIFEFQLKRMDKELAEMVEEYAPALMPVLGRYAPAMTRVVPVNTQIEGKHEVHTYESVRKIFDKAKSFQLVECICRKERALQGHPCKHTTEVCFGLSNHEGAFDKYSTGKIVSKEEALAVLDKSEEEGLVHTTYNVKSGQIYMCNCCSCCCGILRGMKHFNAPYLMAGSNFVAFIDSATCSACGLCANERCPMEAIVEDNEAYRVLPERCIGCGVCTNTCPTGAINLVRKPESLQDEPPANLLEWFSKRADSRGIKITV